MSALTTGKRLALYATAVVLGHHIGTIAKPLGTVGPTEWADWIDLLVPLAVLGGAAAVLKAAGAQRSDWVLFGLGALLYAQGQGLHLGANSINNADPVGLAEDAAHLWDEVVSHYITYVGHTIVVGALTLTLLRTGLQAHRASFLLAALFGLTWTNNTIEGGTPVLGLAVAIGYAVWGWQRRQQAAARLLLAAYGLSFLLLAGFGIWQGGFPQFSELGWI